MSFVRTYDTATAPRGMWRHVLPIFGYPALIWRSRYMIQNSFVRELLSRWHGSFLGVWWMLAQPIFLFCVYYLIFGILFGERGTDGEPDPAFAIYLFGGIIVFHAMIESVSKSVTIIKSNSNLVKKVAFPSEALVIPIAIISLVLYAVGAVVCLGLGLAFGELEPGWMMLTLPLLLIVQFVFTVGLGLLLGNLNVFVPDISNLWRILSTAWFFLSPNMWTPSRLDTLVAHGMPWLVTIAQHCNPAYPLLMCHRIALGSPHPELGEFWPQFGVFTVWAFGLLLLGYSSFMSQKHKYADLV